MVVTLPSVPADGVVEAYDASDALGSIRLDGGELLRFGRSACSFDPVVGVRVRVVEAELGPLGRPRARRVDACGPRELTRSERVVLMSQILLTPVEHAGSWRLAARLADRGRPEHDAARRAIRDELVLERGIPSDVVDEMIAAIRWARELLNPPGAEVQRVVGGANDILDAVELALRDGSCTPGEAERARQLAESYR
jgi:hypothetical protein